MAADDSSTRGSGVLAGIGPGLAVAATGVGAGDLLAAMVAGADFGAVLAWVIAIGALLFLDRPIWLIRLYTITGGLFMPILAASLLWLNSRRGLVGEHRNRLLSTVALVAALALFVATGIRELFDLANGG